MNIKISPLSATVAAILAFAFFIRLGVRFAFGEQHFWKDSYATIYYAVAQNIVSGNGFCFKGTCAWLPPVYPLFLTPSLLLNGYLFVVVPQALLGAGTAFCAFLIGRHIFNVSVGILACAITAIYPYYVVHDTALQETGMVTFCTALSVWLLLRASELNRSTDWLLAGAALGAIPLIRASVAPVVGVGLVWCAVWGARGTKLDRLGRSFVLLLAVVAVTGPWLVRTFRLTGAPVISSQTGIALWMGNNPDTFSRYPAESIDRSRDQAAMKLSETDQAELAQLDELGQSNWFAHRALTYAWENPLMVAKGMFRKLDAGFSWRLNPFREPLAQAVYSLGYVPVAVLGLTGMFMARHRREVILIGLLFIAFIFVTAIFWAHTSHRSYLDVYWIVFAASVMENVWTRARRDASGEDI